MQLRILFIIIALLNATYLNPADKKDKHIYYNIKKVIDGNTFLIDDSSQNI